MWKVLRDMLGGGLEFRLMTGVTLTDPSTGQAGVIKASLNIGNPGIGVVATVARV
jgi:hypothetical protein